MALVDTIKGPIERDLLTVEECITEDDNTRCIATEWRLEGELVKRDVHVIVKRGLAAGGQQAQLG